MYISLEEAAKLEGIQYNTMFRRILRNPEQYLTKADPSPSGGKDRLLIAVSSLSQAARKKYKAQQAASKRQENIDEPDWYVYVDFNWYKENYSGYYREAVEKAEYISKYVNGELKMKSGAFHSFMAEKFHTSTKTIQRAVTEYRVASVLAIKKHNETGENYDYYKVMALGRKPREDCTFPSLTEEMKACIENIYYDEIFAANMSPVTNLYDDLQDIAQEKGWDNLPHLCTVQRYVRFVKEQDGYGAHELAAKGKRYWKNKYMMKRSRDTGGLQPLEVVQGDCHTFDCWVSVRRANGKLQAIRPMLVNWIDTRSRIFVGWVICENPDAQIIKQSLINVIYPKKNEALPYGVPKYLLIDNGKEFTAKTLTGVERKIRFCFDEDIEGFFRSIGINDNMRSLPFQPWSKAQIERSYGTVTTKFTKRFESYVGTLTGKYTESKVKKDIDKMLEKGELLTIEEFSAMFETWVATKYHTRKHGGLVEQGEKNPTPIEVFNSAEKYFKAPPPIDYTISQLMIGETRKVTNMGIRRTVEGKKIYYTNIALMKYIGRRVTFKYFPEDITKVIAYDEDGKRICEAVSYELLHIAPKLSEEALTEHVKDQKRQLRNELDTVKKRKMTYTERQEINLADAGKKVVGPELAPEKGKVTSLINSKRYKEDLKAAKEENLTHDAIKEGSRSIQNEYLKRKADEVFALIG